MNELTVAIIGFAALSEAEQMGASDNGCGKDYANYLRVTVDGQTAFLESDAMEPEDCRFTRDLSWVATAIQAAYEHGIAYATARDVAICRDRAQWLTTMAYHREATELENMADTIEGADRG